MKVNVIKGKKLFYIVLSSFTISLSIFIFIMKIYKQNLEQEVYSKIKGQSNYIYSIQKPEEQNIVLSKKIIKLQELQKIKLMVHIFIKKIVM